MSLKHVALQFAIGIGASFVAIAVAEYVRAQREPKGTLRPVVPGYNSV